MINDDDSEAKRIATALTLYNCMWNVLVSNLGVDIFRGILQSFQSNALIIPRVGQKGFLPNSKGADKSLAL
jgi:hypothetical protein